MEVRANSDMGAHRMVMGVLLSQRLRTRKTRPESQERGDLQAAAVLFSEVTAVAIN